MGGGIKVALSEAVGAKQAAVWSGRIFKLAQLSQQLIESGTKTKKPESYQNQIISQWTEA